MPPSPAAVAASTARLVRIRPPPLAELTRSESRWLGPAASGSAKLSGPAPAGPSNRADQVHPAGLSPGLSVASKRTTAMPSGRSAATTGGWSTTVPVSSVSTPDGANVTLPWPAPRPPSGQSTSSET